MQARGADQRTRKMGLTGSRKRIPHVDLSVAYLLPFYGERICQPRANLVYCFVAVGLHGVLDLPRQ